MRQLTATLEAAQKQPSRIPCVSVRAVNKANGVIRLDWARLYTGVEPDYFHGLAAPGDGSLVRVRITPVSDSRKLYRQRVADPGPGGDFSQWTYLSQYDVAASAAAAGGAEVSIIWIKANREIRRIKSTDNGVNWGTPELIDYTPSTSIYGLAAAYKPNGDLALFFADQNTLYVKKCISGQWQTKSAWDKTTGVLSGVGAIYDGDWYLLVTGKDTAGNYKLWNLVYGDGGGTPAGTWSALKEIASAPIGGNFSYKQPFLDQTDACRCFYIEEYTGNEAYSRPYWSHTVPGTAFSDGLWREPAPFNLSSQYGLAMAHYGDYGWLAFPGGVWRASLNVQTLDVSADIISLRQELDKGKGNLVVELSNEDGRYALPGQGDLAVLKRGCQLEFSPGYATAEGQEYSEGQNYRLEACEYISAHGKAVFVLHAQDGWSLLNHWRARHQFRWNNGADEASVKDIITAVLARVGMKLTVVTQSAAVTGFYPDFTINPENRGDEVIGKLLSFIPDRIFIEGNTACLVNPQTADNAVYPYGINHAILEGRYLEGSPEINRVQVEGWDTARIIKDSFSWNEIEYMDERLTNVADNNLNTVAETEQRGLTVLRRAELEADEGLILVPVNCGQQLYDVIEITDAPAGLNAAKIRVIGLTLAYNPRRGEYVQRLKLGRT